MKLIYSHRKTYIHFKTKVEIELFVAFMSNLDELFLTLNTKSRVGCMKY